MPDPDLGIDDDLIEGFVKFTLDGHAPIQVENGVVSYKLDTASLQMLRKTVNMFVESNKLEPFDPEHLQSIENDIRNQMEALSVHMPLLTKEPPAPVAGAPHYLMISPDTWLSSMSPEQGIQNYARWEATRHALRSAGAQVDVIDGKNPMGGPQETFDRDTFVIVGKRAYFPDINAGIKLGLKDPKGELEDQQQAKSWLQENGFETNDIIDIKDSWFEGGNIVMHNPSHTIMIGIKPYADFESAQASAQKLISAINQDLPQSARWNMLAVPLTDYMNFYHLDLGISRPLPRGEVIIYPGITDQHTYDRIREKIGSTNIIEIDRKTARTGPANLNYAGNTVIMPTNSPELKDAIDKRGYTTVTPADYGLDSFILSTVGKTHIAGPHCITNEVGEASGTSPVSVSPAAKLPTAR